MNVQQGNAQIAIMLGLIPLNNPHKGSFQPHLNCYNPQFFFDKIQGELWYLYPEFDSNWGWLMQAVEFINSTHNQDLERRDNLYTLQYLLNGGYKFGGERYNWLPFTLENVFTRTALFAEAFNKKLIQ